MNFDYDHRLALLDLSSISHISLAAAFLDTVFGVNILSILGLVLLSIYHRFFLDF